MANLKKLKCDNCGANLELDLDHLQSFCPYCGAKLLIDVKNVDKVLIEKEKTKRTELRLKAFRPKNDAERYKLLASDFTAMGAFFVVLLVFHVVSSVLKRDFSDIEIISLPIVLGPTCLIAGYVYKKKAENMKQ